MISSGLVVGLLDQLHQLDDLLLVENNRIGQGFQDLVEFIGEKDRQTHTNAMLGDKLLKRVKKTVS
jgi:hypothetical protein